jgi:putative chitinase
MSNSLIALRDTLLKSYPIDSSDPNPPDGFATIPVKKGEKITYNWIRPKGKHLLFEGTEIRGDFWNWYAFRDHFDNSNIDSPVVREDQVEFILNHPIADSLFKSLDNCLKRFEITTIPRVRHFISQCAHESMGFRQFSEFASGAAYEGRRDLGNVRPGDGRRFKGVGAIQVTGRHNYQRFADFIGDPRVMEGWRYVVTRYPFEISGFWWMDNAMNSLIDRGASVERVTRRVNGGYNGLSDRIKYYNRALQAI